MKERTSGGNLPEKGDNSDEKGPSDKKSIVLHERKKRGEGIKREKGRRLHRLRWNRKKKEEETEERTRSPSQSFIL